MLLSLSLAFVYFWSSRFVLRFYRPETAATPSTTIHRMHSNSLALVTTKLIFTISEFSRIAIFISAVSKSNGNGLFHTEIMSEGKNQTLIKEFGAYVYLLHLWCPHDTASHYTAHDNSRFFFPFLLAIFNEKFRRKLNRRTY